MISFTCDKCGKLFKIPDAYAGRKAKCKQCGNPVLVPVAVAMVEDRESRIEDRGSRVEDRTTSSVSGVSDVDPRPSTLDPRPSVPRPAILDQRYSTPRMTMRTRRLRADAEMMASVFDDSSIISVQPLAGDPPETYRVRYKINSLQPGSDGEPEGREDHEIEIQLTSDYPRLAPKCKILTPIFHPNFDRTTICVGDHWTAGERLVDLVVRIGEMLAFQAYNIQSPLDGEAAMWADLNRAKLPTDAREVRPVEME